MCDRCDWEESKDHIEDMLESDDYEWAEDTLRGILQWIEENEHVTENQKRALSNIEMHTS